MADFGASDAEVNARIVYWGVAGAGKRTNLRVIHDKLRPDHRGELREIPTRLDPTVTSAMLPIELGDVGGIRTRIQIWTAPSGPGHGPSRQQVLDQVDGIVFVVDTHRERIDDNLASFEELRSALRAYGRDLEDVPLVLQYNKRDLGDPYAMEELHRKLQMRGAAAFEAVATEGTAVLQTLTTISKRVIRHLREHPRRPRGPVAADAVPDTPAAADAMPPAGVTQVLDGLGAPDPAPVSSPSAGVAEGEMERTDPMGSGIDPGLLAAVPPLAADGETAGAAQDLFEEDFQADVMQTAFEASDDEAWETVEIADVGLAVRADARTVRVPLTLRDERGRELRVSLCVRIDPDSLERE